jgi:hypothetical protein
MGGILLLKLNNKLNKIRDGTFSVKQKNKSD